MKIRKILYLFMFLPVCSWAGMDQLNDTELDNIDGQAGADLQIFMSLNHSNDYKLDTAVCSDLRYCRLGVALNNRTVTVSGTGNAQVHTPTGNNTGRKQWVVLKGIQGTIDIQKLMLDGTTVNWNYNGSVTQPSVAFGFDSDKPIKIRNLGFESIAVETDTVAQEGAGNDPGYLVSATSPSNYTGFDAGREKGFLGLKINTNLTMTGNIKMFACGANHPRC